MVVGCVVVGMKGEHELGMGSAIEKNEENQKRGGGLSAQKKDNQEMEAVLHGPSRLKPAL